MLAGKEDTKLARIADCIQINTDYDLLKGYTMLALEARVKSRTTFMRKLSDMGDRICDKIKLSEIYDRKGERL